jgi:NADPH:quinone reductase
MKAQVLDAENQMPELRDVPQPKPRKGEALVKVSYSGVNYADTMMRRGLYPQKPEFPFIPGFEFSGVVAETGDGVKNVKPGDRVMGTGHNTYAEYTVAGATNLIPVPPSFTDEQAAAFPVVYITAYAMLKLSAHAQAGETILVHAAAGGVGTASVQLAKHLGLRVIGTASSDEKLQTVARLGADVTINYGKQDFVQPVLDATGGRGADIVFESIGGDFLARDIKAAAPFGRIVVFGMASGSIAAPDVAAMFWNSVSVSAFWMFTFAHDSGRLAPLVSELLGIVDSGKIVPVIWKVYPLEQGAQALKDLESRKTVGKVVLKP